MVLLAALLGGWACATVLLTRESPSSPLLSGEGLGVRVSADSPCPIAHGVRGTAPTRLEDSPLSPGARGEQETDRAGLGWALGLWLCVGLAALAKGPAALLVVAYVFAAAPVLGGSWRSLQRTGWWWGLPLAVTLFAGWAVPAYMSKPVHFKRVIIGDGLNRHALQWTDAVWTVWKVPAYAFARSLPWSILAVVALAWVPWRAWLRERVTAAAVLWLMVCLVGFGLMSTKRPDRLAPMSPALAVLAAAALPELARRLQWTGARLRREVAAALLLVGAGLAANAWLLSGPAKGREGEHVVAFARQVRQRVGGEPVVCFGTVNTPVQPLLGRMQVTPEPDAALLAAARWVIRPVDEADTAVAAVVSEPIAEVHGKKPGRLGLFPMP